MSGRRPGGGRAAASLGARAGDRASVDAAVASASEIAPALADDAAEAEASGFPTRSVARLATSGLLAAPLPTAAAAAAGAESLVDARHRLALLRVLAHVGRGSLPVGRLYEGHVNALALIGAYGTSFQREAAAAASAAGALFAVWNTEPHDDGVRLVHRRGVAGLSGCKTFGSGAGHVAMAVLTARDDAGGRQMVLLDLRAHPPSVDPDSWQPLGMRPTASRTVRFDAIGVRPDALLGPPGAYLREPVFSGGAVRFCAVQIGGTEAVFDATRRFLRETGREGDPQQRARLGEMAMHAAGAALWMDGAARNAEGLVDEASTIAFAHLMRAAVEDAALAVLRLAERSVGARGLLAPHPFERMHRDMVTYLRQAGPDAAVLAAGSHVLAADTPAPFLWRPAGS